MLRRQILALQLALAIPDGQLLALAQRVAGDASLRCIEDMIAVDMLELLDELRKIEEYELCPI